MSQSPTVYIWVGFSEDDVDLQKVRDVLTPPVVNEEGEFPIWETEKEVSRKKKGFVLEEFYSSEQEVGIGSLVFSTDWNCGVKEFDFVALNKKAKKTKALLEAYFYSELEFCEADIKVFVHTDLF